MDKEIWKKVAGWDYYMVSSYGRVKSIDRIIRRRASGNLPCKGKILSAGKDRYGYLQVMLCDGKKQKIQRVHRLVAEAFLYKEKENFEVNHIDFDKTNNKLENLEWVTRKQNTLHSVVNGKFNGNTKKLSENYIKYIEEMHSFCPRSFSYKWLGKTFGISEMTVAAIINKTKRWS